MGHQVFKGGFTEEALFWWGLISQSSSLWINTYWYHIYSSFASLSPDFTFTVYMNYKIRFALMYDSEWVHCLFCDHALYTAPLVEMFILLLLLHVCTYAIFICVCECFCMGGCMCACQHTCTMYVHVCRSLGLMLGIFLKLLFLPLYNLHWSLAETRTCILVSLANQLVPGRPCYCLLGTKITGELPCLHGFYMGLGIRPLMFMLVQKCFTQWARLAMSFFYWQ